MAHARRKYFDLYKSSQSPTAKRSVELIGELYEIERLPTHPNNRIDELLSYNWRESVILETDPASQKIPSNVGGGCNSPNAYH